MKTTLNKIRAYSPCTSGWEKLLSYLGKTKADDEPLEITTIIDSNGLDDALWCLQAVEGYDKELRLFAVWCTRQVQHLMKDQCSLDALDVAERYANGQATNGKLTDAWYAARAAAVRTAYAAENARFTVVCNGAADAARAAASDAVRAAAMAAACEAARTTRDEMKRRQEAELRRICEEG